MKMQQIAIGILASASLAAGLVAATPAARAADDIKIGSFLAVTGPASFLGDPEKKTLEMLVEQLNAKGGLLGKQVDLIVYDSGGDAKKAVTFAKRLVEQDEVNVLIGGSTTGETMAVIQAVDPQLPFVSLAGASVVIDPVKHWVFKTPHTDRMAVGKVYADMKKNGITKIGLIAGSGGFDKSCTKNAEELAGEYGITIAASENYGKGDTDMTPQLTNIKNANIEATLFCGFGAPSSIVARNYRQLAIAAPLYYNHGSCSKEFIKGAAGAAEGVKLPCAALIVADQLPADDPQKAVATAYIKAYKDKYGEDVSTFGGHAYDAFQIVTQAIERAGTTDPAKVRDEIEATKGLVGVDGIFTMSPTDHMGLGLESFKMVEVSGGDWKLLY